MSTLILTCLSRSDRLSSTPFRPKNNTSSHAPPDMGQVNGAESRNSVSQRHASVARPEGRSVTRSALDPMVSSEQYAYSSGWPQLEQITPHRRNVQQQQDKLSSQLDVASNRHSPISPGRIRSGSTPDVLGHAYATGSDRKYDSYSASQTSDLDEIIQEIARNDQILELQQKLSSGEIEHEKQVSTMALLLLLCLREEVFYNA